MCKQLVKLRVMCPMSFIDEIGSVRAQYRLCVNNMLHTTMKQVLKVGPSLTLSLIIPGTRCSSVVRAFAHGAMGRWIDRSWGGLIELFLVPASAP